MRQCIKLTSLEERSRAERREATPSSLVSTRRPSPSSNEGGPDFEGSQLSEADSELSAISSEAEESSFSGSDEIPIRHAGRKRKTKGKGLVQRLDGVKVDDDGIDLWKMTEEERMMTIYRMREKKRLERKAWEEARAPLKKKEQALKKILGRKLTNGERNFIALSHVSYSIHGRRSVNGLGVD